MEALRSDDIFVGMEIEAWFKNSPDTTWGNYIPCTVIDERTRYFVCEVNPHKNRRGWGLSLPYKMTIDKFDLDHNSVSARRCMF